MAADTNLLLVDQGGLFTHVEHTILASWFGQQPPTDAAPLCPIVDMLLHMM
jgi:hypothetical protein